ncbi:CbrC family protein [Actinocrispum sp. NPDC049592]|uniref:CbrC family protein n=1 Tax=Actinocrispum sp. NPDC049592 TaxID=3154835 RepID=UPI0034296D93
MSIDRAQLPQFAYHPDPLSTGCAVVSDEECVCCGASRGVVYRGPVFCEEELDGELCLWCIADGRAAEWFDAVFTDAFGPDGTPAEVIDTITRRTPGFSGWQQEEWMFHCGDGAAFLGAAGARELRDNPQALDHLRTTLTEQGWPTTQIEPYLAALTRDGQPTAYLFQCRTCHTHLAYSDSA